MIESKLKEIELNNQNFKINEELVDKQYFKNYTIF